MILNRVNIVVPGYEAIDKNVQGKKLSMWIITLTGA